MAGVDPRIEIRQARAIFACCSAFRLSRAERLDIASVMLNRTITSFREVTPHEIEQLWFAFNGAVYVAKVLMDRKEQEHASR